MALVLLTGCPPTLSRSHSPAYGRHLAEAERHVAHGRRDRAVAAFLAAEQAADRRVDREEAQYRRARTLWRAGQFERAVALFDALANARPVSRRTVRAAFDAALLRARDLEQPDRDGFRQVVRTYPESGVASRALRWLLRDLEPSARLRECAALRAAVGASSLGDDLRMAEYEAHLALGDRGLARAALEALIEEHPYPFGERWDDASLRLAAMWVEDGEDDRALAVLETMLERAETTHLSGSYTLPGFPLAHLEVARIYARRGDRATADRWFASLPDAFPTCRLRDDAMVERGEMWLAAGEGPRGCTYLRQAVETFEVGSARRRAARVLATECENATP